MQTIRAIYENGQIRLLDDVELQEGQELVVLKKVESKQQIETQETGAQERVLGLHRGLAKMSDDFDAPLTLTDLSTKEARVPNLHPNAFEVPDDF